MSIGSFPKMTAENRETYFHMLGVAGGWEAAGDRLLDQAAGAFRDDYNDHANLLKDAGQRAKQTSVALRIELDEWAKEHAE